MVNPFENLTGSGQWQVSEFIPKNVKCLNFEKKFNASYFSSKITLTVRI